MSSNEGTARKRKPAGESNDIENQSDDEKKVHKPAPRSALKVVIPVVTGIIILFCLFAYLYPSPINPVEVSAPGELPYFDGVMLDNKKLHDVIRIGEGKLPGPESIQVDKNGVIYTGLHDGRIVKILRTGEIKDVVRTGSGHPKCGDEAYEHICGRPFGIHFDRTGENLVICDGYFGLMKYNLATETLTTLLNASEGIGHVPFKYLNHLTISSEDKVYFTDSSWRWAWKDYYYLFLEGGGQGRVLSYDLNTGASEVLLSGLFFANGIALSPDENFIVVCETTASRIIRLFIKGKQKGVYDLFHENLPGYPDNIRASPEGGYWVALPKIRKWPFSFFDMVGPYPRIKSLIAKLIPKANMDRMLSSYGLLVKLDYYGDMTHSYHDSTAEVIAHISEVYEDSQEGVLYMGSFKNNFIGKFRLKD